MSSAQGVLLFVPSCQATFGKEGVIACIYDAPPSRYGVYRGTREGMCLCKLLMRLVQ